ncbi:hypothetical protein [Streptomyces sp. NPDC048612]|uniref:hypothetical protein n=1 Tax=Streptomyces sp. NPDC048612 TaxID=3365579 RepID=UPI0037214AB0
MLRHPLASSRPNNPDHAPIDVRQIVGDQLPTAFGCAPRRPALTATQGSTLTEPGSDESMTRTAMPHANARWGVRAA